MRTLIVNRNIIVSIFTVMLLIYGVQGTSYAQDEVGPGDEGTLFTRGYDTLVTPGETNTSLKVSLHDPMWEANKRGYQVQLRRKDPQGDWILKCDTIKGWLVTRPNFGEYLSFIFTDLEPGTTYEARWRETNETFCSDNPAAPGEWTPIREGTTLLETPPRVEFADTSLAIAVRLTLGLNIIDGVDILKIPEEQLTQLTTLWSKRLDELKTNRFLPDELDLPKITHLTGLEHATQLSTLTLAYENISDLSPLTQLTELRELNIEANQISDLSPLTQLTELRELKLGENEIMDITPLAQLTQLTRLELRLNRISDINPLAQLTQLTDLFLSANRISDISPLAQLTQLTDLLLSANQIRDISLLAQLTQLRRLFLGSNQIRDLTPLAQLASLEALYLQNNQIRDVTPLAQLADASLTDLDLRDNQIRDVSPLAGLVYLEELSLRGNPITDTFPLSPILDENPDLDIDIEVVREKGGPTITASAPQPLTAATLNGSVVTLTLSSGGFIHGIRDEITVSGVTGISVDRTNGAGEKITVELKFEGNVEKDAILIFTLEADAIEGYDGPPLTAELSVSATYEVTEGLVASTAYPLTEANLHESVVTLTLRGRKYTRSIFAIRDSISVAGIAGVTIPWNQPKRKSDTQITIELEFDGNM
ncbi:MAG: leucine-rich repeat domain-containing protein, partial [Candidatus Poribacteria bacterium]|nr:leucine-rich repeat domain-containing protein [Candidatus Poribacteria bacterium]